MPKPMAIQIDLSAINQLTEIVIRAGDLKASQAVQHLIQRYEPDDRYEPMIYGLSTVFRQGASLDQLAKIYTFPNKKLSVSFINALINELAQVQHGLILYVTPTARIADHHTLAITYQGLPLVSLRGYSKSHFTPGFSWAKKGFPNKLLLYPWRKP